MAQNVRRIIAINVLEVSRKRVEGFIQTKYMFSLCRPPIPNTFSYFVQIIKSVGECEWNLLMKIQNYSKPIRPSQKVSMVGIANSFVSHIRFFEISYFQNLVLGGLWGGPTYRLVFPHMFGICLRRPLVVYV